MLASNPNFISGIYKYCDRWCERCPFTSRCMSFFMADERFSDPKNHGLINEAYWRELSETFKVTLDFLKETAEQNGIDLDSLDIEEAEEEERLKEEIAESNICCRVARAYGIMVDHWFGSADELFQKKEDTMGMEMDPPLGGIGPFGEKTGLEDAIEVIRWYQHQIYVKLMRAIRGKLEEGPQIFDEFPRDSDGSAKVALIGMDRAIAAWGEIRGYFPMFRKDILDMLGHLEWLREEVERIFPNAREFIRPGFDKIKLNG